MKKKREIRKWKVKRCGQCGQELRGFEILDEDGGTSHWHQALCPDCRVASVDVGDFLPGEVLMEGEVPV